MSRFVANTSRAVGYLWLLACMLACSFAATGANAQGAPQYKLVKTIEGAFSDFEVDNLGNLYTVGERQQVKKLNENFDSVAAFNDVRKFGRLYALDVSNPLRVLLYYKDFLTIQILDRFLNIRTTLDLRQSGILQCPAIAQSFDNNIWVFDEMNNRVKKLDESGRVLLESPDFRVVFDEPPQIIKLEDYNKYLYAYDPQAGLVLLDFYGAYRNLIPLKGWQNIHGMSKGIVATNSKGLVYYKPGTPDVAEQPLPAHLLAMDKLRLWGSYLYAMARNKAIYVYQIVE
jgi:hypothetical protein